MGGQAVPHRGARGICLGDVDPDACRVRITAGRGNKDCMVPSQPPSRAAVGLHIDTQRAKGAGFLFESSWQKPDSTRGCKLLTRYATAAGIAHPAMERHEHRQSLEVYSRLSRAEAQQRDDKLIDCFPA